MATPNAPEQEEPGNPFAFLAGDKEKNANLTEIQRRRNHPLRRAIRVVRSTWYWVVLVLIIYFAWTNPVFLNLILFLTGQAFRLLFVVSFILIQFIAMFWFIGRAKTEIITPDDPKTLTFDDYKGQPRLLALVKQWMSLLSDRRQFKEMGGEFINGLLFYGAPGTGKTMLAKAMAGESGTAFISIEGSGFRGMFMGMDVLKMMSFVNKARKLAREYGACIAFIDEIDAVGASRGNVMGGAQPVGHQSHVDKMMMGGMMGGGGTGALTRLLTELDGVGEKTRGEKLQGRIYKLFGKEPPERNWHVLFVGSTNRPDILDPALTRPGRLDRRIEVSAPDRMGRTAIIEYYLSKIRHDDSIDVEAIVSDTSNYTPAQIMAAITKDAVRLALFDGRDKVNQRDVDLAFQEQSMGLENPIEDLQEDQREQVAYHEAGHAIAVYYLMPEMRMVRATIIRRSNALGYVHSAMNYELHAYPLSYLVRRVMVSLAGDVATKLWSGGEAWSGTAGDFQHVRALISFLRANGFFGPPILERTMTDLPKTEMDGPIVTRFWNKSEDSTERLLRDHWEELDAIAQALLEKGDLSGVEVVEIIQGITGIDIRAGDDEEVETLLEEGEKIAEEAEKIRAGSNGDHGEGRRREPRKPKPRASAD